MPLESLREKSSSSRVNARRISAVTKAGAGFGKLIIFSTAAAAASFQVSIGVVNVFML